MTDMEKTQTKTSNDEGSGDGGRKIGQLAGGMVGVMETARGAAENMANQLPTAADRTRQVVGQANEQMQSSSDEMLMVGSALAFGVAAGLFMAGSSRLIVTLSLVPAAAMAATLVDRRSRRNEIGG